LDLVQADKFGIVHERGAAVPPAGFARGLPTVMAVEICYVGWQESLVQLATLVEPEIPD
jgi:hypothetical protein